MRGPRLKVFACVCVCVCICIQTRDLSFCVRKPTRTSPKKTKSKQWENNERSPIKGVYTRGCVRVCVHIQNEDFNKRGTIVPGWGGVPGLVFVYKTNEDIAEKWENNERYPIEGVYTRDFV